MSGAQQERLDCLDRERFARRQIAAKLRDRRSGLHHGVAKQRLYLFPPITAVANDVGPEVIFLRQLIAHGRHGDVAIAISTSGGSANLIAALEEARKRGMLTVGLLGYDGGEIVRRGLVDIPIVVHCDYIPRIQEVQASIYHVMTEAWRQWPR